MGVQGGTYPNCTPLYLQGFQRVFSEKIIFISLKLETKIVYLAQIRNRRRYVAEAIFG